MALNPNPIGKAIADYLWSNAPAAGHQATLAEAEAIWQGVMTLIYNDIKANMDVLPTALSGTSLNNPVGQAVNIPSTASAGSPSTGATSALQTIQGKGSVV